MPIQLSESVDHLVETDSLRPVEVIVDGDKPTMGRDLLALMPFKE